MEDNPETLLWTQPEWLAEAQAWVDAQLAAMGRPRAGEVEQIHARPWSTVLRIPVECGALFFKANMPLLQHEGRLTDWLHRLQAEAALPVLAVDQERGWVLLPDGGATLRTFLKAPADLTKAEAAIDLMARVQIAACAYPADLLRLTPFDRRLGSLPERFVELLDDRQALLVGQEEGLREDQWARLREMGARFDEMCSQLAETPIPHSLHHDDFHDANIFCDEQGQHPTISDWAESCVTHPFFSMVICLRSLAYRAGLPDEAVDIPEALVPELAHLRDQYLQPWEPFGDPELLVKTFNLAWRVAMVNRALTWQEVAAALPEPYRAEYTSAAPAWLGEFLTLMERDIRF